MKSLILSICFATGERMGELRKSLRRGSLSRRGMITRSGWLTAAWTAEDEEAAVRDGAGAAGRAATRETAGTVAAIAGRKLPATRQNTGKNTDRKADARIV